VFQCYLDDSGTSGLPIVTMAGFVAAMQHWETLEPTLDSILNRDEISVLHAKEFHDTKPPFQGWTKDKKQGLADELFTASHGLLYGLSVSVRKQEFEKAKKEQGKWNTMSAIGVCFSTIMTKIVTDPNIAPAVQGQGISFLIETGNRNNSEIEKFFHRMAKMPAFEGCLRSISFIPKTSCRAIQLADFLAFYSRRRMRNHARFDGKFILPACPFLDTINKHGPLWLQLSRGSPKNTGSRIDRDLVDLNALTAFVRKQT
jgi:Protein of unknown function (DUF3800)